MNRPGLPTALVVSALAAAAMSPLTAGTLQGQPMDPTLPLYQFTRAGHQIMMARIVQVHTRPAAKPGEEAVEVTVERVETLWRDGGADKRQFEFLRPAARHAQLKFPHPTWGRVALRPGAVLLLVAPFSASTASPGPIYVDPIAATADPALAALRSVLEVERQVKDRGVLFQKRLAQLQASTVEKLFAAEALAMQEAMSAPELALFGEALARSFADEASDFVKLSLGAWLWDRVYPSSVGSGRVQVLNATLRAAASPSATVRTFALDRISQADLQALRDPAVVASVDVLRQLQSAQAQETDAQVRKRIDDVLAALRR